MLTLTSCGTKEITEAVAMENVTIEETAGLIVEDAPVELETSETEEPTFLDYEDLYLADNYLKTGREKLEAVNLYSLEKAYEDYVLSESTDLYNVEGTWVGYSKPDIKVTLFGINEDWAEVSFVRTVLYIPRENFDAVASATVEKPETEILLAEAEEPETKPVAETPVTDTTTPVTEKPKTETPESATSKPVEEPVTVTSEPVVTEPSTEPETIVIESNKYTPEEAVAVYRSIMEANGIQWDPSIKEFASWGTGWIYLTKGEAERAANSAVEVYKIGGGDITRPWTHFYVEMSSSDDNAVYITEWNCD